VVEEEVIETTVVVLTRDLSLGDRIEEGDVSLSDVPVEIAPRNVLTTVEEAIGKIVKTDLVQGEMLLLHNLADPTNNNKDLSFILSDDHVLLAFPASDLMSVHSMVQRGDIVDIFATFTQEVEEAGATNAVTGEEEEPETRTFTLDSLQKVTVTAMVLQIIETEDNANPTPLQGEGGEEQQPAPEPDTRALAYLLALDPQDALLLKHLKDTGAIFDLVLRAPTSTVEFDLTPVTEEYIVEYYGLEILP
jgi:pilus assembly protein CpaB